MQNNRNPFAPKILALLVSQAIYRMRMEAAHDRRLIEGYSK